MEIEKNLREDEETLNNIYNSVQDSIIIMDNDGNISYWNKAAERIFKIKKEEIMGKKLIETIMPARFHKNYIKNFQRFQNTGKSPIIGRTFELTALQKDGTEFPVEISLSSLKIKNKWNAIWVIRNITERKKIDEQLRKFSRAIEQGPTIIIITDTKGNIEYVNQRFSQLSGYVFEDVLGKNCRILKSGNKTEQEYKELWETIMSGEEWRGEFLNKKKNGEFYWEFASISSIKNSQGAITQFLKVAEDISLRKTMEEELREAKEAAEAANKVKSEFLKIVSHDIRTPFTEILTATSLLLEEDFGNPLTEEQKETIEVINNSAEKQLKFVNDLLILAIQESDQINMEKQNYDLRKTIHEVIEVHKFMAQKKNISLINNIADNINICVDINKISHVFGNLISNAIKFTPKHGKIEIFAEEKEEEIFISIKDSGTGFSEEKIKELLYAEKVYSSLGTEKEVGTGLGTKIIRKITQAHNGKMLIQSEEGKGSIFTIVLPYQNPKSKEE
ncbi:MAG: PAS domain-containing sensor histidine kinase [Armatimonadetes bacterium]|nr:PAS domain-containing sensor histidine kinase [Armatimonadota bacterium]